MKARVLFMIVLFTGWMPIPSHNREGGGINPAVDLPGAVDRWLKTARGNLPTDLRQFIETGEALLQFRDHDRFPQKMLPTVYQAITRAYYMTSDYPRALARAEEGEKIARQLKDQKNLVGLFNLTGMIYFRQGEYTRTRQYFRKLKELTAEIQDRAGLAGAYNNLGIVHETLGEYPAALENYLKSLEIKREMGDQRRIASTLNNIGVVYKILGRYDDALDYYFKSMRIKEHLNDRAGLASTLSNISSIYTDIKDYDTALEHYQRSLDIDRELGNRRGVASTLKNIGDIYQDLEDFSQAIDYHTRSLEIRRELKEKSNVANSLVSLGEDHRALKDYTAAISFFQQALEIKQTLGEKRDIANIYLELGRIHLSRKEPARALTHLHKAAELAGEIKAGIVLKDAFKALSELYESQNRPARALQYHKEFKRLNDEIFNEKTGKRIADIRTRYQTEKKDREIQLLTQSREIQNLRLRQEQLVRNTLIAGLLILGVVVFLTYRQYRAKAAANRLIEEQNRKLDLLSRTDHLTRISNRSDFLERCGREMDRFQRSGKGFSIAIGDIDHFKKFNDRYGHACGDQVLIAVAGRLRSSLRRLDHTGRWGGEEFILLLPETGGRGARVITRKILKKIAEIPIPCGNRTLRVTMTFGICEYDGSVSLAECIQKADQAMYRGKQQGRNQVVLWTGSARRSSREKN